MGLTLQSGKVGHFCTAGGVLQHPYIGVPAESPSYLVGSGYGDAEINFEQPGQRNWTDAALDDAGTKFFACASNDAIYHCDNGVWTRHAHTNDWAQIECDRLGTRAIARCSGTNYVYYWDGSSWEPQVALGQRKWRWVNMDRIADTFWAIADGYDWLYEGEMQ